MADTAVATPPKEDGYRPDSGGAIPYLGLNIPMPASVKPPPVPASQQSSAKAGST